MATESARWMLEFDDRANPVLKKLDDHLGDTTKKVNAFNGASGKAGMGLGMLGDMAKSLGPQLAAAFTVGAVMKFGEAVVGQLASFEKYDAVLTNTFQSSRAAAQAMSMIRDVAATTPFQVNELTESYIKFANRGIVPTRQEIISLGDFAASTGKGFDQLTEAILDASNPERWKEFGVKVSRDNGMVTMSYKGMTETVKDNAAAVEGVIAKWGKATGIAGNMAAQSERLGGKLSNLADSWDAMLLAIGQTESGMIHFAVETMATTVGWIGKMFGMGKEQSRQYQDEADKLRILKFTLQDTNTPYQKRLDILRQIKSEYPELIGNIEKEAQNLDLVASKIEAQIQATIKKAAVTSMQEKMGEKIAQGGSLEAQMADAQNLLLTDLAKRSPKIEKYLRWQFGNEKTGQIDWDSAFSALSRGGAIQDQVFGLGNIRPANFQQIDPETKVKKNLNTDWLQQEDVRQRAYSIAQLAQEIKKINGEVESERSGIDAYMERYGVKFDNPLADKDKNTNKTEGNGSITTSITSAAPKVLNVNIDAVHKGDKNYYGESHARSRRAAEEEERLLIRALGDAKILNDGPN